MYSWSESPDVLRAHSTTKKVGGRATKAEGGCGEKRINNGDARASFTNTDQKSPANSEALQAIAREEISAHDKTLTRGETISFTLTLCSLPREHICKPPFPWPIKGIGSTSSRRGEENNRKPLGSQRVNKQAT